MSDERVVKINLIHIAATTCEDPIEYILEVYKKKRLSGREAEMLIELFFYKMLKSA